MPQLTVEDISAGSFLITFGTFALVFNSLIGWCMLRLCKEITGFRFLFSHTVSDVLLIIQFTLLPGIIILSQHDIIPKAYRWHFHHYLDFTWWAMVWHYMLVALTRLCAIGWPKWFKYLSVQICVFCCIGAWSLGLLQSLVEHQFSSFVSLYYDAKSYGLTANWEAYNHGTSTYYLIMNLTPVLAPLPVYVLAMYVYLRRRKRQMILADCSMNRTMNYQLGVEKRLLLPCSINAFVFIFEQVIIAICSRNYGKWITFTLIVLFALSAVINPATYFICSSAIRSEIKKICRQNDKRSFAYEFNDNRSVLASLASTNIVSINCLLIS
uniref:G_PROTEIN_RECEP_F1_2 domain-containing protein n=1 Tax=Syphacia muris TaxID=451379 RepID=A0A0N5AEE8_9BILA